MLFHHCIKKKKLNRQPWKKNSKPEYKCNVNCAAVKNVWIIE